MKPGMLPFVLVAGAAFGVAIGVAWLRMHRGATALAARTALGALGVRSQRRWYRIGLLGEGEFSGGRLRIERGLDEGRGRFFERLRTPREPQVLIRLSLDTPPGLRLRTAVTLLPLRLLRGRPEPTLDPMFDRRWDVQGPSTQVRAVLSAPVRAAIDGLNETSLRITDTELRVTLPDAACSTAELLRCCRGLAQLRTVLSEAVRTPLVQQLAWSAEHDPEPAVRAACFTELGAPAGSGRDAAALRDLAPRFISDPTAAVRLLAASHLGSGTVEALTRLCADAGMPAEVRAGAWRELVAASGSPNPAETLAPLFGALWPNARGPLRAALLADAGRLGLLPSRADLQAAAEDSDLDVQQRVAIALGRTDAEATPTLLTLLGSGAPEVAEAAASALGQVGDARALPELQRLAQSLLARPALRQVTQVAARRITRRLNDPAQARGVGGLSLVGGEAGALSEVQAGQLSALADHESNASATEEIPGHPRAATAESE